MKQEVSIMEDGSRIQGHMAPTVASRLKIKNECIRVVLAETLCTFIMMVFGLGTVAQVVTGNGVFGEYFSINVGFGLSVAMGVHVGGKVSGAHMNAAVSFTMCVFGRLRWKMFPLYVFAQFLGSFLAAGTIFLLYYDAIHHYCGGNFTVSGPKATAGIFATYPAPFISIYTGFFDQGRVDYLWIIVMFLSAVWTLILTAPFTAEDPLVLGTAMLLLCLMALADQRNQPVVPRGEPVGVGLLVLLIGVSLGSNSGYAINPTRDLGPRVFTLMAGWGMDVFRAGNGWWWVPLVAPFIGGVTGALIYEAFVELHHPDLKSTKTQSAEDPECVPLEKCKNSSTEISV